MFSRVSGRVRLGLSVVRGVRNWPRVFLNYFGVVRDDSLLFRLRSGEVFRLRRAFRSGDTSGLATVFEIFLVKNYCPPGMEVSDGDVVVDIGANIGVFSLFAALRSPSGKVFSFEPFPNHFLRLRDTVRLNALSNVVPCNLAVSGRSGGGSLFVNDECSGMHSLVFDSSSGRKVDVSCVSLSDVFRDNNISRCDFLKLDCEGSEYDILYNTPSSVFSRISKIALEFDNLDGGKRNARFLKGFLESRGFEVFGKGFDAHQGILYAKKKFF